MKKLCVNLKERSYNIFIGAKLGGLGLALRRELAQARRALVITNPRVKKLYFPVLAEGLKRAGFDVSVSAIPEGEKYKNLDTVSKLYSACLSHRLDRRSCIIALGGGVVGDIAGFVAATYMRGVSLVHVPTTLLAMVDSSIGGKTGVDLKEGKNLVGAFYQPEIVWADISVLNTLPERELRNGLSEVIKYGVISDRNLFSFLEKKSNISINEFEEIVLRCALIKAKVVEQDERELKGLREILNFGHTAGHAIETLTGYSCLSHGEAVAIGMNIAAGVAETLGLLSDKDSKRITNVLSLHHLPIVVDKKLSASKIINLMWRDKKVIEGKLRMVLPTEIGKVIVHPGVPPDAVLKELKS